jgi:DNA mismatch endonuclease (patch repair protein)
LPETEIRRRLYALGLRYRIAAKPDPGYRGTADIVFRRALTAVFIDGCFWHGCPDHYKPPTAHAHYWAAKVARNAERDRTMDARLRSLGWLSLRIWEHESPEEAAQRIASTVVERLLMMKPKGVEPRA